MKLSSAFTYLSLTVVQVQGVLRGSTSTSTSTSSSNIQDQIHDLVHSHPDVKSMLTLGLGDSSCMTITDEDQCNGSKDDDDISCVWCKCSAVPSECLNTDQAKKVPSGVFECATPNGTDTSISTDTADMTVHTPVIKEVKTTNNANAGDDKKYDGSFLKYDLYDDEVSGELCDPNSKSLSGYIDITGSQYDDDGQDKHLFYWFFEKRAAATSTVKSADTDATIPLILWLTGGPGCSSTLALLTENGPCSVTADGASTQINPYSWTEAAHVLWLDQPAGVGYSYGKQDDYNEEMISEDAYYFLQNFFKAHPEYSSNPLYVIGESYGGHYAPAIAHKIKTKNDSADVTLPTINLSGLAVGNGLTDPVEQYKWYPEMVYNNSHGIKVVSKEVYDAMNTAVPKCVGLIEKCNEGDGFVNKFACQSAFVLCNIGLTSPYQATGLNPYDIRKQCGDHPLCYDFSAIEKWLNNPATKKALHVKDEAKWQTCNMVINLKFHTDWMKDFSHFVKDLVEGGIPALIYAGDVDFICNYLGNKAWTLGLDWEHKDEFNSAEEKEWGTRLEDGKSAGLVRSSNGLTFMQVYDAGHMVPSDQPDVALNMIKTFVGGGSFE